MYGSLVITYLFLGGTAAGALFVVSAWSLSQRLCNNWSASETRLSSSFASLRKRIYAAGFVMLALAMVCLLWDLGNPGKALLLFLFPHPTVLTFGAYALAIELLIAGILAATHMLGRPVFRNAALGFLEGACCVGALTVMGYTGVFLASGSVAFWSTWTLVGLFVFSSLSAGVSAVLLIDWLTHGQSVLLRASKPLQKWHLACLAFEAIALLLFIGAALENPAAASSRAALLEPNMLATATVGVAGFGIALPAALESFSLTKKECRTIPVSDIACLFGCLTLRFVVIACGAH